MSTFTNIEEALEEFGERIKDQMIEQLMENKSFGKGDLARSIKGTVTQPSKDDYLLTISMLWYGKAVDEGIGRGPGKMPPVQDIQDWIKYKKIPKPSSFPTTEAFAWAVAKTIAKNGTDPKPRPFIMNSIETAKKNFGDELLENAGEEDINKKIQQAFINSTKI